MGYVLEKVKDKELWYPVYELVHSFIRKNEDEC